MGFGNKKYSSKRSKVLISSKFDEGKKKNWNWNLDCNNNLKIANGHDFTKLNFFENI